MQINSANDFGGGEKHLIDLTRCLQIRGHQISAAVRPNVSWQNQLNFLPKASILRLSLSSGLDWKSIFQLAKFIKNEKIEILHAHLARDYPLAALAVRLSRTNARLILTRHVLFPVKRLHRFILPENTTFIAVSKAVETSILERKIVPANNVKLVYNGIDTRFFAAARRSYKRAAILESLKLAHKRRFVGIVGAIVPHKGQIDFVHAAAILAEKFTDVDFLVIGEDDSQDKKYRRELEKIVGELNLENRVFLTGWFADVAPILCVLEVFVSASHFEPFGLVIIEAMATGLPVVAVASEGAREILINNETGKLVKIGSAEAIAYAVGEFLSDEQARKSFGRKAESAAREKFDLSRMVAETEKIYEDSLSKT